MLILRQDLIVGRAVPVRQAIELTVGVSYALLRDALGPSWRPQRVCFTHEPPRDRSNHSRILGQSALDFRQEFNGIVLNRRMLDTRIPNADPGMVRLASKLLEVEPWARSQTDSAQVRDLVALLLSKGSCTVDQVAQHLLPGKAAALVSIANYFLFFGSDIISNAKNRGSTLQRRRSFTAKLEKGMGKKGTIHKCTVCGITEGDDPVMDFRYCSTCEGHYEYCMKHLKEHEHIKNAGA